MCFQSETSVSKFFRRIVDRPNKYMRSFKLDWLILFISTTVKSKGYRNATGSQLTDEFLLSFHFLTVSQTIHVLLVHIIELNHVLRVLSFQHALHCPYLLQSLRLQLVLELPELLFKLGVHSCYLEEKASREKLELNRKTVTRRTPSLFANWDRRAVIGPGLLFCVCWSTMHITSVFVRLKRWTSRRLETWSFVLNWRRNGLRVSAVVFNT